MNDPTRHRNDLLPFSTSLAVTGKITVLFAGRPFMKKIIRCKVIISSATEIITPNAGFVFMAQRGMLSLIVYDGV